MRQHTRLIVVVITLSSYCSCSKYHPKFTSKAPIDTTSTSLCGKNTKDLDIIYFEGYKKVETSGIISNRNKRIQLLQEALNEFQAIQQIDPNWRRAIVNARIADIKDRLVFEKTK